MGLNQIVFAKQDDSMQCGIACLAMICSYYKKEYSIEYLSQYCFATTEGVSLLGISEAAGKLGFHSVCGRITIEQFSQAELPCILHWNQNHFVVLYKVKGNNKFYIADPGKGLMTYSKKELEEHWISTLSNGEEKGIAMFLNPTPAFYQKEEEPAKDKRSFAFLFGYFRQYRKFFGQIVLGLFLSSLLQLILPFLTQAIVDVGITHQNIGFVWLILLGQLMITIGRTSVDFIR
ncbi:MAG: cysteine peptidase family C39 domain-containing protein, partial [Bacteroidales bacterium]